MEKTKKESIPAFRAEISALRAMAETCYGNETMEMYLRWANILEEYRPSAAEVKKFIGYWETLDNYVNQEKALDKLFFELCPHNKCIEDVLIKCSALNDFYSTNIYDVHSVAQHIFSIDIDERLIKGDLSLIDDITIEFQSIIML